MKYLLPMIALSLLSHTSYCQTTEAIPLKEINLYLTEGLECKELLDNSNRSLVFMDSLLMVKDEQLEIMTERLGLSQANVQLMEMRDMITGAEIKQLQRKTIIWKGLAILGAVATGYITYTQIK